MVRSPAGRRPRAGGASPDEWLEVPGWRRPLDTLLVLAVTFATAWVGLVVIPAAANSDSTSVTDPTPRHNDASPATTHPTQDSSQWFAGPVFTGGPAAPTTTDQAAAGAPVVAVDQPALRATPTRTTPHPAPWTSARPPAPKATLAAAPAAVTTPAVTAVPTTTPAPTTTPPAPPTTTTTTTSSSTTTTSAPTTSSSTSSSSPASGSP